MTENQIKALKVGKWSVGYVKSDGLTLLKFAFTDRDPLILAIPRDQAEKIARAMLDQLADQKPTPDRMN